MDNTSQPPTGRPVDDAARPAPSGPSVPTMVTGLLFLVVAAIAAVLRLTGAGTGVPPVYWVIIVFGGVLVVAGLLGLVAGRRAH